jgi:hypothetical protein
VLAGSYVQLDCVRVPPEAECDVGNGSNRLVQRGCCDDSKAVRHEPMVRVGVCKDVHFLQELPGLPRIVYLCPVSVTKKPSVSPGMRLLETGNDVGSLQSVFTTRGR